jgi:hypothetical protein
MTVEGKETLPVHCESCARLALPDTFKTSATSPKSANWTSVLILFSPPPQQTPLGGSTEPRNATKPSKIRDVNFTVKGAWYRHCQPEFASLSLNINSGDREWLAAR